jgi:hypothetical protein
MKSFTMRQVAAAGAHRAGDGEEAIRLLIREGRAGRLYPR